MKIHKLNNLLADRLGRTPHGGPLYKWVQAHDLHHYRHVGEDWTKVSDTGLMAPTPRFERVSAYPHLGSRWVFARWLPQNKTELERQFGSTVLYHRQGQYFPVVVMREGKKPDLDVTEFFIQLVKAEREKTVADIEAEDERREEREDRAIRNTLYSIIDDATTAFGNDPGKRSGGVSFPSPRSASTAN